MVVDYVLWQLLLMVERVLMIVVMHPRDKLSIRHVRHELVCCLHDVLDVSTSCIEYRSSCTEEGVILRTDMYWLIRHWSLKLTCLRYTIHEHSCML